MHGTRRRPRGVAAAAVLAAVCAAGVVPTGGTAARAAEPSPLDVFRKFIQDSDPALRRKAVAALAEERGADVVRALLQAARDEDAGVRGRAVSILLAARDRSDEIGALAAALGPKSPVETRKLAVEALAKCGRAGVPGLRKALEDKDSSVRRSAARGLGPSDDSEASRDLHVLLTDPVPLVRADALVALGQMHGGDAAGTATAIVLADRAPEPRIAGAEILARFPSPDTVDALAGCLRDDSWSLRTAAARALSEHGRDAGGARRAAAALVRALEREPRLRVRVELAEALWALTAIDFGPDAGRWLAWFREAGERFDPPAKRPHRGARAASATFAGLVGLPLESEHVSFVFDASTSMNDPVRFGVQRTKRDDLQDAFAEVVARLPKPSWINLIPFATEPMPMKPALFEANASARAAAVRHLAKTQADGRTNIHDALEIALADPDADTIVLLTDGAPSAGKRTGRTDILDGLRELNRFRLARVHTVEIGAAATGARWKGFLADIAQATGGHHVSR